MAIEITKLTAEDMGRWVHYKAIGVEDRGRIKSWNHKFVFVVYSCADNWDDFMNYTGEATHPDNITFCEGPCNPLSNLYSSPLEHIWCSQGTREHIPCTICGDPTLMLGTKLCGRCWEVVGRISGFICCENAYQLVKETLKMYEEKHGRDSGLLK